MTIHLDDQERVAERERDEFVARYSRRGFLGRMGLGAGAVGAAVAGVGGAVATPSVVHSAPSAVFGRMFPDLPSFQPATNNVRAALRKIGDRYGIMDARDDLKTDNAAFQLIVNADLNRVNRNNGDGSSGHTAGTTFMGQFMDHDMTFDTQSVLGVVTDPARSPNARNPTLDLDSVYLLGPVGSEHLYSSRDRAKLRVGTTGFVTKTGQAVEDLPRDSSGNAFIGDPRNDENIMLAGLHAAFLKFHNNMVDLVRSERMVRDRGDVGDVYRAARNQTRWHYQYMIVSEFLPLFVGQSLVNDILSRGRRFYKPSFNGGFMPVEFQGAAYRFGHSMVRPSYRANFTGQPKGKPNAPEFFGLVFDPDIDHRDDASRRFDRDDLMGGHRAPRRFVGWPTFFRFPGTEGSTVLATLTRPNKLIDTKISSPLFDLPLFTIAGGDTPTSLPQRNLLRHLTWSIPSGQAIAREMGIEPLERDDLVDIDDVGREFGISNLDSSTPLWFYIFREAEKRADGKTLGPVGGRIVAEVIIGLLQTDENSYLNERGWSPIVDPAGSKFAMSDFLTFAGVNGIR